MSLNSRGLLALAAAIALAPFAGAGGPSAPPRSRRKGEDRYPFNTYDQFPREFWVEAAAKSNAALEADAEFRKDKRAAKRNTRGTNWKAARKQLKKRHQQPRRDR